MPNTIETLDANTTLVRVGSVARVNLPSTADVTAGYVGTVVMKHNSTELVLNPVGTQTINGVEGNFTIPRALSDISRIVTITEDSGDWLVTTVDNELTALGAAGLGANADITSMTGLTSGQLYYASVALSSAQILALYATPVSLIAAPGAGKVVMVKEIEFIMTTTGTAYASGGVLVARYTTGTVATINTIAANVVTAGAGTSYTVRKGIDATATANSALEITNATGAFTTGTGTAVVRIWYTVK